MSESLDNREAAQTDSKDVLRAIAAASGLAVVASYVLPWADIVGPTAPADVSGVEAVVELGEGDGEGTISAFDISALPEVVVGFALIALVVTALRWNRTGQIIAGVVGLLAAGVVLFLWSFITTDDPESLVELGDRVGPANAFEPGIGLWIALFGSLALVVCGLGAAVREYAHDQENS